MANNFTAGSGIAQISIGKLSSKTSLSKASNHNNRLKETGYHIDEARAHLNITETLNGTSNYYASIVRAVTGKDYSDEEVERIPKSKLRYADGRKVNANAVLAAEAKIGFPGKLVGCQLNFDGVPVPLEDQSSFDPKKGHFYYPEDKKEFEEWKSLSIDFMKDRFGESNIFQVQVHMDESVPHMHVIFSPMYQNEKGHTRLSYHRYIDGPKDLVELQSEYATAMSPLGYERGEAFSSNISSVTAAHARAVMAKTFDSVPKVPSGKDIAAAKEKSETEKDALLDELSESVDDLREFAESKSMEAAMAKVKMKQTLHSGEYIKKLRMQKEALKDEKNHLQSQLDASNRRIHELEAVLQAEEYRRKGLELHKDKELVESLLAFDSQMEEVGREYFNSIGIKAEPERANRTEKENAK